MYGDDDYPYIFVYVDQNNNDNNLVYFELANKSFVYRSDPKYLNVQYAFDISMRCQRGANQGSRNNGYMYWMLATYMATSHCILYVFSYIVTVVR